VQKLLAPEYRDAFYQLVLHPITASANLNELYVVAAQNKLAAAQGRAITNRLADRVAELFARDAQIYLLALMGGSVSAESHARARDGFVTYAAGIDQALLPERRFLVGEDVTLADICFVAEMSLFFNEKGRAGALEQQGLAPILHPKLADEFPRAMGHLARLRKHPAFAPDVDPYLAKLGVP